MTKKQRQERKALYARNAARLAEIAAQPESADRAARREGAKYALGTHQAEPDDSITLESQET